MFKFLKEKLKSGVSKVAKLFEKEEKPEEEIEAKPTEIIEAEPEEVIRQEIKEEKKAAEPIKDFVPEKSAEDITGKIKEIEELKEDIDRKAKEEPKRGVFEKIKEKVLTRKIDEEKFDEFFQELEVGLLENNVAFEVVEKIKDDLKKELVDNPIARFKIEETIKESLRKSIESLFDVEGIDVLQRIKTKKPYVICFVGINGSGKTTTIAKVAKFLKEHKLNVVIAAADTFRAASIEQIELHGERLGVKVIKHNYGADPAAVAFDAIKHAKAKNVDVVLIDTAGRMHSNTNLVNEMKKIMKVAQPDLKIFIGESITGNDCIEQARIFDEAVDIDGIILTKADVDEKGGTAISIGYVTKKPILFFGVGQEYSDLKVFDKRVVLEGLEI